MSGLRILMAASEAVPFCKTGGLADVAGALSQEISRSGNRVALFLPKYRNVAGGPHLLSPVGRPYWIPVGDRLEKAGLFQARWGNVQVYFVECPKYFDREGLYRTDSGDYEDNAERFILFSRAVLEGAKLIGFKPDVIHVHDWQTALIPAYLRTLYRIDAFFIQTASLLTIHNIAYQGLFPREVLFWAGFGWSDFTPERLEFFGNVNFLKAGLVFSDLINTVSPNYAKEIQASPEFGRGLEGVLRARSSDLTGVLNGIDTEIWNPETDSLLPSRYGMENFDSGKRSCKRRLREKTGLQWGDDIPLVGIVSRLDPQKGLDLVLQVFDGVLGEPVQWVVLGSGSEDLKQGFTQLSGKSPARIHFRSAFDDEFAHLIYAASDIFLMPSRFEPCGLGQMIAMRYGAIPVVTRTGGLADTVADFSRGSQATGFISPEATVESIAAALRAALVAYGQKPLWRRLVLNAMGSDFSWEHSAAVYLSLYRKAIQRL